MNPMSLVPSTNAFHHRFPKEKKQAEPVTTIKIRKTRETNMNRKSSYNFLLTVKNLPPKKNLYAFIKMIDQATTLAR